MGKTRGENPRLLYNFAGTEKKTAKWAEIPLQPPARADIMV
jgi:hypothetical protein